MISPFRTCIAPVSIKISPRPVLQKHWDFFWSVKIIQLILSRIKGENERSPEKKQQQQQKNTNKKQTTRKQNLAYLTCDRS